MARATILPAIESSETPLQFSHSALLLLFLKRETIRASWKSSGNFFSPQMLCRTLWKASRVMGHAALYSSTGIPSFPGALPPFIWRIALLILSMEGDRLSSWRTGCWGIWFRVAGLAVDGLLSRLLKCSASVLLILPDFFLSNWCRRKIEKENNQISKGRALSSGS